MIKPKIIKEFNITDRGSMDFPIHRYMVVTISIPKRFQIIQAIYSFCGNIELVFKGLIFKTSCTHILAFGWHGAAPEPVVRRIYGYKRKVTLTEAGIGILRKKIHL
jgi:hypothetical protein